jgi:hypothetical protein
MSNKASNLIKQLREETDEFILVMKVDKEYVLHAKGEDPAQALGLFLAMANDEESNYLMRRALEMVELFGKVKPIREGEENVD